MTEEIIDRGRGPEIAGTRTTVYHVLEFSTKGDHPTYIAACLGLSSRQVLAALRYIEEHKVEVMAEYRKIRERIARGNPPEIEALRAESHAKLMTRLAELRAAKNQERNGASRPA